MKFKSFYDLPTNEILKTCWPEKKFSNNTFLFWLSNYRPQYVPNYLEDYPEININHQNNEGWTPLMVVVCSDKLDEHAIESLINAGADTKLKNNDGMTALMIACRYNRTNAIKQLIYCGMYEEYSEVIGNNYALKCQVDYLTEKYSELETMVKYMPGGDGYLEAKSHFTSLVTNVNNNKVNK